MLTTNRLHSQFDPWKIWSQFNSDINDFWGSMPLADSMPLNLWSSEGEAALVVELPGYELEDIQLSVHRDALTIEAERRADTLPENATAIRQERTSQRVTRQIQLPFDIDAEQIDASYANGLLRVKLSRHPATMPQKISVKAG